MVNIGEMDRATVLKTLTQAITTIPTDTQINLIEFGEDVDGNVREIKFYESSTLILTLTFSNAGAVDSTWTITRT